MTAIRHTAFALTVSALILTAAAGFARPNLGGATPTPIGNTPAPLAPPEDDGLPESYGDATFDGEPVNLDLAENIAAAGGATLVSYAPCVDEEGSTDPEDFVDDCLFVETLPSDDGAHDTYILHAEACPVGDEGCHDSGYRVSVSVDRDWLTDFEAEGQDDVEWEELWAIGGWKSSIIKGNEVWTYALEPVYVAQAVVRGDGSSAYVLYDLEGNEVAEASSTTLNAAAKSDDIPVGEGCELMTCEEFYADFCAELAPAVIEKFALTTVGGLTWTSTTVLGAAAALAEVTGLPSHHIAGAIQQVKGLAAGLVVYSLTVANDSLVEAAIDDCTESLSNNPANCDGGGPDTEFVVCEEGKEEEDEEEDEEEEEESEDGETTTPPGAPILGDGDETTADPSEPSCLICTESTVCSQWAVVCTVDTVTGEEDCTKQSCAKWSTEVICESYSGMVCYGL